MLSDVRVNEIRTPQRVVLLLRRPHAKMKNLAVIPAMRRGARVAESACLESTCAGNGTVGSNPTLSATTSGGVRTGGSEGVCPLHGVTGAQRRREGAGPLAGAWEAVATRLRIPTLSATTSGEIRTGVLKGVGPLHGVTGAKRRRDTLENICQIL